MILQSVSKPFVLQWGRNLIVAEGRARALSTGGAMIWLQWGRNLIVAEGGSACVMSRPPPCFNGAAT